MGGSAHRKNAIRKRLARGGGLLFCPRTIPPPKAAVEPFFGRPAGRDARDG